MLFLPSSNNGLRQVLIENKSKFVLVHASSGHKRAVEEILSNPAVQIRLADTKAAEEIRALQSFFDMLKKDPERAYYGYNVRFVVKAKGELYPVVLFTLFQYFGRFESVEATVDRHIYCDVIGCCMLVSSLPDRG